MVLTIEALKHLWRVDESRVGRTEPLPLDNRHYVNGHPLCDAFTGLAQIQFGLGCFWGAERLFWQLPGVFSTAAGYAGGGVPYPTYREVCSGRRVMQRLSW